MLQGRFGPGDGEGPGEGNETAYGSEPRSGAALLTCSSQIRSRYRLHRAQPPRPAKGKGVALDEGEGL